MRVLHLLPYLELGGTERAVFTLSKALPSWESKVLAPHGSGEAPFRRAGLLLPWEGSFSKSLKGAIASWQPNLLHLHAASHYFFTARKTGLPLVFTGHGYPTNFDYWLSSILSNFWAQRVICVSHADKIRMRSCGLREEKACVIYNGVFQPQPDSHRAAKLQEQLCLAKDRPTIVMAGRLVPDKGCADLLEALAILPQKPQLVLAGTGPMLEELHQLRLQLGLEADLVLPGYMEHPEDLLSFAHIAVLPSYREGMPLFLLEAMAQGKAIVATDVGGIPEALGEAGLMVPARDPQRLAGALQTLLADGSLRQRLGVCGQKRWQELFSAQSMAQQTEGLYSSILAGR